MTEKIIKPFSGPNHLKDAKLSQALRSISWK